MQDWEKVRRTALSTARREGLSEEDAQDLASEVTLAMLRGNGDPSRIRDSGAYVRSAAQHEVARHNETKRRREAREKRQAHELACKAPGPEEVAAALGQYAEAIRHLDEDDRKLIGYVAIGMTSRQVGAHLGISAEAARKRLQRVREAIRMAGTGE